MVSLYTFEHLATWKDFPKKFHRALLLLCCRHWDILQHRKLLSLIFLKLPFSLTSMTVGIPFRWHLVDERRLWEDRLGEDERVKFSKMELSIFEIDTWKMRSQEVIKTVHWHNGFHFHESFFSRFFFFATRIYLVKPVSRQPQRKSMKKIC